MEDDDVICDSFCDCAAQPYSTIPTVLELQQMRNRLNMAQAGKEIMKWNSNNTGEELKKLALDLRALYTNYGQDMRRAFLLLARCRYFDQEFYRNVTESVKSASLQVQCACTTIAGVNTVNFTPLEISNTKVCKCPFLCRGGQAIQEAKKAWFNIIRTHIKMAELRTNFQTIENAYKNNTKRLNIISQIVLPKTQATINYILVQLEETTREESHRIKVKSNKLRNGSNISYIFPGSDFIYFKSVKSNQDKILKKDSTPNIKSICDILPPEVSLHEVKSVPIKVLKVQPTSKNVSQVIDIYEPMAEQKSRQKIESLKNFYEFVSTSTEPLITEIPKQRMYLGDFDTSKDLPKIDKATHAMEGLLEACKLTRNRLSTFAGAEEPCQMDSELIVPLGQLKSHIQTVIEARNRLQSSAVISRSVKNFIKSCEEINNYLKYAVKDINTTPLDKSGKRGIQHLISSINNVVKIITYYRSEGLLTPSLEEFSKVCTETRTKIGFYNIKHDLQKIDYLKSYVSDLESITSDITRDGIRTPSIQNFLISCKGFKEKLEEHKRRKKQPIREFKEIKSIKQESETDTVTSADSDRQFITANEDFKKPYQGNESSSKNASVDSLYNKRIGQIAKFMTNIRNRSKSVLGFIKAKSKIYNKNTEDDLCSCQSDSCERFQETFHILPSNTNLVTHSTVPQKVEDSKVLGQRNDKIEENLPETDVNQPAIEENVTFTLAATLAAEIKENVSKVKEIVEKVKETMVQKEEETVIYDSKPTQFPSKIEEVEQTCAVSFDLSEISETTLCSDSSCLRSDIIVAEINTYDSCPVFKTKGSSFWPTSSDSWTKPLLQKECYCVMCSSKSSSSSLKIQVCAVCEKKYAKQQIVRALAKTYTM